MKGTTENPVTKKNLALLGRRWYIVGKDGESCQRYGSLHDQEGPKAA